MARKTANRQTGMPTASASPARRAHLRPDALAVRGEIAARGRGEPPLAPFLASTAEHAEFAENFLLGGLGGLGG